MWTSFYSCDDTEALLREQWRPRHVIRTVLNYKQTVIGEEAITPAQLTKPFPASLHDDSSLPVLIKVKLIPEAVTWYQHQTAPAEFLKIKVSLKPERGNLSRNITMDRPRTPNIQFRIRLIPVSRYLDSRGFPSVTTDKYGPRPIHSTSGSSCHINLPLDATWTMQLKDGGTQRPKHAILLRDWWQWPIH
jgi:hypothetical protein